MNKRIVFCGTPEISVQVLKSIYQNGYQIDCVYTQPPVASRRGQKVNKSPVHLISETLNLTTKTPAALNNEEEKNSLKRLNIDLGITVAYGQILNKDFLNIPKYGWINVHYSLLPKFRGASPVQRAIMEGENLTGVSIMQMREQLDSGPICNQYPVKIISNENSEDLAKRLSTIASEKIIENIDNIFEGKAVFREQDHKKATYAKKIDKAEGKISWDENAKKIIGKVNGLYPFPGAFFNYKGERYKILKAELSSAVGEPGLILNDNFEIGCANDSIRILEIQRQGKKVQKITEFMLGTQMKKGINLKDA